MALIRPYVTDRYTSYKGDEILTLLSIAIWLKDDYTKKELVGNGKVVIKEGDKDTESFKNLSGYYIFTNLENRDYNISIETEFYFPADRKIDPSKIKNLADLNLSFDGNGPAAGAYSAKLGNVSELQKNYVLEFRNSEGQIEERSIIDIDTGSRTIYWDEALKYDFNAPGSTVGAVSYLIEFVLKPRAYYPFPANSTLVRGLIRDSGDPGKPVTDATVKVDSQNLETKSDENGEFVLYFTKTTGIVDNKINFDIIKDVERSFEAPIEEGKSKSAGIKKFP
jgi:hypothetical protein